MIILFITAVPTRFVKAHKPEKPTFDEPLFLLFCDSYYHRRTFFDIHPPLAKFIITLGSYLGGYDGTFGNVNPSNNFPDSTYVHIRHFPQIMSSLCIPLCYISLRTNDVSITPSLMSSIYILCDTAMISEGRIIVTDGFLHFFVILNVLSVNVLRFKENKSIGGLLAGMTLGFAFAVKWTSGGLFVFNVCIHLAQAVFKNNNIASEDFHVDVIIRLFYCVFIPLAFQLFLFCIHWSLSLYHTGYSKYLPPDAASKHVIYGEQVNYTDIVSNRHFIYDTIWLCITIHKDSMGVAPTHFFCSKWWQWPILSMRWCDFSNQYDRHFFSFGQPFVWITGFIGVILATIFSFYWFFKKQLNPKRVFVAILCIGYWSSYLPFALIPRSIFFYHYIIPAIFSGMSTAAFLDSIDNQKFAGFICVILSALAMFGYLYWFKYVYGFEEKDTSKVWRQCWWPELSKRVWY